MVRSHLNDLLGHGQWQERRHTRLLSWRFLAQLTTDQRLDTKHPAEGVIKIEKLRKEWGKCNVYLKYESQIATSFGNI